MKRTVAVSLADEFDSGSYAGRAAKLLCTRASVSGLTIGDPDSLLTGYKIAGPHHPRHVGAANVLAAYPFLYDTKKADTLLIPSAITGTDPASDVDHYRCVTVKVNGSGPSFPHGITLLLTDRIGSRSVRLKKPTRLCVPTMVDGSPIDDALTHLVCYKIGAKPTWSAEAVGVSDEFGDASLDLLRESELCVPSVMR